MGLWGSVGAFVGSIIEPGGGTAVGAAIGGALDGPDDGESQYCPGQAPTAAILQMIAAATLTERGTLDQHWAASGHTGGLFADRSFTQLRISPSEYSRNVWGGNDCQVTTAAGGAQKSYVQSLLTKYATSANAWDLIGETDTAPPATSPATSDTAIGRAWDILRDKIDELPADLAGAVVEVLGEDVRDVTRPVVQERATERFLEVLPVLAIGVVLALLLFRRK